MTDGILIGNFPCDDCGSRDNLSIYETEEGTFNGTCWGTCKSEDRKGYKSNNTLSKFEVADELGIKPINKRKTREVKKVSTRRTVRRSKKEVKPITPEQIRKIKDITEDLRDDKFRSIEGKWYKQFRVIFTYNQDGEISEVYYPVTKGKDDNDKPKLMGYHKRITLPKKDFRAYPAGSISKECELFGQWKWKGTSRLVLTGGENDVIAAKKMHEDYRKRQNRKGKNISEIDFGSCVTGEGVMSEQIRLNYDVIDSYDEIILDLDADEAGLAAEKRVLEVLPHHKVKVMRYSDKDANEALDNGNESEYISAIYQSKKAEVAGIHGSSSILKELVSDLSFEKLPLPDFMSEINSAFNGGYDFGTFNLICGDTSCGKTTLVNTIGNHIVEMGEYVPTIVSLEAKRSVLTRQYLSIHLNKRLASFKSKEELEIYLNKNEEQINEYLTLEDGSDSFYVIDDRARLTTIDETFKMIERAIIHLNSNVLILDVYTDMLDSLSIEEQNLFNGRIKSLIAKHNICIIAICHTRKLEGRDKDGNPRLEPSRHDLWGSKTTIASATSAIFIWRDLQNPDPIERNTTYVKIDKNRDHSVTGPAGRWLYLLDENKYINREEYDRVNGSF